MEGLDITKFTDEDLKVEGYIAICDDMHGFIGPMTIVKALLAAIKLNLSGTPCKYRVVGHPGLVSKTANKELFESAERSA